MFKLDSKNDANNDEYSLYKKYFDNCDVEDDENIYKKQLYVLEDENFTKKDETPITLKHKSLLNRLILEDYSVYPLKKNPNENNHDNIKTEEIKDINNNNNNDKLKEKEIKKKDIFKNNKKIDELEKFAEDENEFIKDLHRINYITFSPFSLSFFNKEDINEKYKGRERTEKIIKEKENEKKLFQMIDFDYNKYEFNEDLFFNICHGFVDMDKLKEENCINPPYDAPSRKIGGGDNTNKNIEEKNEKSNSLNESISEQNSEYNSKSEEEEEEKEEEKEEKEEIKEKEKEEEKEIEEVKEEKKDDIIVSELIDEINKYIKERENIEFFEEYFDNYYEEKKKVSQNMKITDEEEKKFYREWIEKFNNIEILYNKYLKEQERLETIKKEMIKRELKKIEDINLKKKEEEEKFMEHLREIKMKTKKRLEEEKKEKIYFATNEIDAFKDKNKNKRKSAIIIPTKEKKENKTNQRTNNKNKKSQTQRVKVNNRIDLNNPKKDN